MTAINSALLGKVALPIRGGKGARQSAEIAELGPVMQPAMDKYAINTFLRQAHFLAQTCTESHNYSTYEEYASGEAYEGRSDLGNTQPGDGKRYKGRGLIQLTGRANYRKIGAILGLPLEAQPELATKPEMPCSSPVNTGNPTTSTPSATGTTSKVSPARSTAA